MLGFLPVRLPLPSVPSPLSRSNFSPTRETHSKRRRPVRYITCQQSIRQDDDSLHDFVSNTTHVVLDSRDIPAVLDRLKGFEDDPELFFDDFLHQAEHHVDATHDSSAPPKSSDAPPSFASDAETQITDYFHPEFLPYMPRWARDAFHANDTVSLKSTHPLPHRRRLRDIAEQPAGITDCLLSDVAEDYGVPVEFIFDAVLALGVDPAISVDDSVKDTLNDKQLAELLRLVSTFDAADLADRYSDRCVKEMAEDYDLDLDFVMQTCEGEGFHMCSGRATRLSLIQEDRILDILLKEAPMGSPYPSALEGLF